MERTFKVTDYGVDNGFGRFVVREGSEQLYGGEWLTDALSSISNAIFHTNDRGEVIDMMNKAAKGWNDLPEIPILKTTETKLIHPEPWKEDG